MTQPWYFRLVRRFVATRFGSFVARALMPGLDRWMLRRSRGKRSAGSLLTGLPVVMVTTIGAKSGQERTLPLVAVPNEPDGYVLIASNFGRPNHPAWYHNLRKNPRVVIGHGDSRVTYLARQVEGDERETLWQRAVAIYPGYDSYAHRAGRVIPVIALEPQS